MRVFTILMAVIFSLFTNRVNAQTSDFLLKTSWNQFGHYNDLCPKTPTTCNSEDPQLAAGCVAVALAQIINYHKYPSSGRLNIDYIDPANQTSLHYKCYIPLRPMSDVINFSFDWSQMPAKLISSNTNVQNLILYCGLASNMDYGTDGSSSNINNALNALKSKFGYSSVRTLLRGNMPKDVWGSILMAELDAKRPIYFRGDNNNSKDFKGHAWVCDGYKKNAFGQVTFHMNWGWGGDKDGWFDLDMIPTYNYNHIVIIGIQSPNPAPIVSTPTNVQASDGSLVDRVRVSWTGKSGNFFRVFRSTSASSTAASALGTWQTSMQFDDLTAASGVVYHYFVKAASDATGANASGFSSSNSGFRASVADLRLNTQMSSSPNPMRQGQAVSVSVALRNLGSATFQGEIACSIHNLNSTTPLGDIEVKNLSLAANGTQNLTFSKSSITTAPGTYHLYLKQKPNNGSWSTINANGFSNPLTITITGATAVPQNVIASKGTFADKVVISWDGTSGAFFRVYRNTSSSIAGATAISNWQSGRTFNDLNATPGLTYYYFVAAASNTSGSNPSAPSIIISGFRAATLSLSPAEYRATAPAGSGSVNVFSSAAWTARSNQSWCTVTTPNGSGGSAAMAIRFSWSANTSSISRNAIITVSSGAASKTLTVIQPGVARPANDEPCNSISISPSASGNFITGSNIGATTSTNPGSSTACGLVQNDVWFSFVVPASGSYTIVTKAGTLMDAVLAVYVNSCSGLSGGSSASLCKDNNNNGTRMPVHPVGTSSLIGRQIHVRVWGKNGATGTFSIGVLNRYDETTYNLTGDVDATTMSVTVPPFDNATKVNRVYHNDNSTQPLLEVFPNPVMDILNLRFSSETNSEGLISIVDLSGKVCLRKVLSTVRGDNLITLDLGSLPNGTYSVTANVNEKILTQRLVIIK